MNKVVLSIIALSTLLHCMLAQAMVFPVSEQQLNNLLKLNFPMVREFQGIRATFYDPSIRLSAPSQKVILSTAVLAMQNGQSIRAAASIEGVFSYNAKGNTIQFASPKLTDFQVIDNQLADSQAAIEVIKQQIGQNLPIILLVDFKQLNIGIGNITPRSMTITKRGLEIGF